MVKLRLSDGKKKQPSYRLIAIHSTSARDGKFIEILGHYNPQSDPKVISFDEEKIQEWLKKGAVPSETVKRLLEKQGIIGKEKKATDNEPEKKTAKSASKKHKTEEFLDHLDTEDNGRPA